MRIAHHRVARLSPDQRAALEGAGARDLKGVPDLPGATSHPLVVFDIDESDPAWPAVQALADRFGMSDLTTTKFDRADLRGVERAALIVNGFTGYPQPRELESGYLEVTYDPAKACPVCRVGLTQRAPFQMRGEPRLGRKNVLELGWVHDEIFVTQDLYEGVFRRHGVPSMHVNAGRGRVVESVVQVVVEDTVEIDTAGLPGSTCAHCGQTKFLPVTRGPLPAVLGPSTAPTVKSDAWFGSGGSAWRLMLVSGALRDDLERYPIRGARFEPAIGVIQPTR
jgi:hypothetical protein